MSVVVVVVCRCVCLFFPLVVVMDGCCWCVPFFVDGCRCLVLPLMLCVGVGVYYGLSCLALLLSWLLSVVGVGV